MDDHLEWPRRRARGDLDPGDPWPICQCFWCVCAGALIKTRPGTPHLCDPRCCMQYQKRGARIFVNRMRRAIRVACVVSAAAAAFAVALAARQGPTATRSAERFTMR